MKLFFKNTCEACPEQYDVYDEAGSQVGYVRLRWGHLSASAPDFGWDVVYEYDFSDGLQGCFDDQTQRDSFLQEIGVKILEWLHENGYCLDFTEHELECEITEDKE